MLGHEKMITDLRINERKNGKERPIPGSNDQYAGETKPLASSSRTASRKVSLPPIDLR